MYPDTGICGSWPSGHKADTRFTRQFAVCLGHVGRTTFLAANNGLNGVLVFIERVNARKVALARHQEYPPHAVVAQLLDKYLAAISRTWD